MLRAVEAPLLADVPGLAHGFEQRLGPDGWETREQARERVAAALAAHGRLLLLHQVHGADLLLAPWEGTPEADAGLALEPGWLLGIETADCLPVLLVDPVLRRVAAAHAGWRGTAAGVARATARALVERGSRPEDLLAALGPCIGPCCYEVGDELRQAFGPEGEGAFRPGPRGRPHLDLRAANRRQLVELGLRPERLSDVDDCTCCRAERYHSYRRDGRGAGRMLSFVGFARG